MLPRRVAMLLGTFLLPSVTFAQSIEPVIHIVMLQGSGGVTVPLAGDWSVTGAKLYDNGTRPSLEMQGKQPGTFLSILVFPVSNVSPTANACREDVIKPLLNRFSDVIDKKSIVRGELTTNAGVLVATISYSLAATSDLVASVAGVSLRQQNTFAFYGDRNICAEMHISQMLSKGDAARSFESELKSFMPDGAYVATAQDYAKLASVYYRSTQDYPSAASYYQRSLDNLPEADSLGRRNIFRFLNDQLSMSYGMSGNLKRSREVNEAAILKDPDYPLYYYNLACADAESGKADDAKTHLQQAFDRRSNTLPGEKLPDPAQDDSFKKLKRNKDFWAFVQSLPRN